MLTYYSDGNRIEFFCLSTDTKPEYIEWISGKQQSIPNGSLLLEMNTKKFYAYDAENNLWREQ